MEASILRPANDSRKPTLSITTIRPLRNFGRYAGVTVAPRAVRYRDHGRRRYIVR
jgi:hypothetical protein